MLADNIKKLRKQKGYSQETLAQQLHVVRQTVSKWEKGLSVPDASMLQRLAEVLEVSVKDLLGEIQDKEDEDEIAKQLAILNNQLANKAIFRRKILKIILIILAALIIIPTVIMILGMTVRVHG